MATSPASKRSLQLSPNALTVLEKRYLIKDDAGQPVEEASDLFWRVARTVAEPTLLVGMSLPMGAIEAGDVNGDGLEDLVFSDSSQTRVFVTIPGGEEVINAGN